MARDVDYRPDNKGWRQIRNSPELTAAVMAVAETGAEFARSISPRESGEYAKSFRVERTKVIFNDGPGKGPRVAAKIENTSGHAAAVEWGLGHRVLGRTLEHLDGAT